jgi:hypothetical protein
MKKTLILFSCLLLASSLSAAGSQMNFGLNFGIMTDDSFSFDPLIWSAGAELDFQFGDYLMLSPEVTLYGNGFKFKEFLLFPGAVLNFTPGSFFVGGGLVKGIYIGSGSTFVSDEFSLKLNAGLISKNMKLTAYLITSFDSLFDGMLVGATLGFRL